jgi:hypothetical protein
VATHHKNCAQNHEGPSRGDRQHHHAMDTADARRFRKARSPSNDLAFSGGRERERGDRRVRPTATPCYAADSTSRLPIFLEELAELLSFIALEQRRVAGPRGVDFGYLYDLDRYCVANLQRAVEPGDAPPRTVHRNLQATDANILVTGRHACRMLRGRDDHRHDMMAFQTSRHDSVPIHLDAKADH